MLTLTLSAILDKDKNVTGFLCDQKDTQFAELISIVSKVIPRDQPETRSDLQFQLDTLKAYVPMTEHDPIYSTHEYLRGDSVEVWTVYKIAVLNSLIHYIGLRMKVIK